MRYNIGVNTKKTDIHSNLAGLVQVIEQNLSHHKSHAQHAVDSKETVGKGDSKSLFADMGPKEWVILGGVVAGLLVVHFSLMKISPAYARFASWYDSLPVVD